MAPERGVAAAVADPELAPAPALSWVVLVVCWLPFMLCPSVLDSRKATSGMEMRAVVAKLKIPSRRSGICESSGQRFTPSYYASWLSVVDSSGSTASRCAAGEVGDDEREWILRLMGADRVGAR